MASGAARAGERTIVTGGAGFIGGRLCACLLARGDDVTVYDSLENAEPDWRTVLGGPEARRRVAFVQGEIGDLERLTGAVAGHDRVVHLAASTDIAAGFADPRRDLDGCVIGTWNVLEAMRRNGVKRLLNASSGVVYGGTDRIPTPESHGPLVPDSHYAAGKLAAEALVSGYAQLYGWRAMSFRFGNTVGGRSNHGVVHDLVVKVLRRPECVEVLGDGSQRKPYLSVEDLVDGVLHAWDHDRGPGHRIYNVGTAGTLSVREICGLVPRGLGLDDGSVHFEYLGAVGAASGGWHGDTPLVSLDTTALEALGWRPRENAAQAVERAARDAGARLRGRPGPLLTASERSAVSRPSPASERRPTQPSPAVEPPAATRASPAFERPAAAQLRAAIDGSER